MSFLAVLIVKDIAAVGSGEVASHGLDDGVAGTAVPLMSPALAVAHCIHLTVGDHNDLRRRIYTFLPDPPAFTF